MEKQRDGGFEATAVADGRRTEVVCTKPRWWCSPEWSFTHLSEDGKSNEVSSSPTSSSPPFFSRSPPLRVTNPLAYNSCFHGQTLLRHPPTPPVVLAAPGSASAVTRIEGFDCLNRGHRDPPSPVGHRLRIRRRG